MLKKDLINRILEIASYYEGDDLKGMSRIELEDILEEITGDSDMYPNGRDYEAEDEE